MKDKLVKLLLVSRPISWVNTAFPFAAAYLLTGGKVDVLWIVATLYFLWPYNLLMYGINDVFDYESDIQNPRKGGIEGMREERTFHPTIVRVALALNIPLILIMVTLGSPAASIVLLTIVFAVVAYSVAGLRFKEVPIIDSMTSSLHFVGPMLFALALTGFDEAYYPYVIAFFLWGMASHAFGAIQDIIPDRKGGISSIATVFGAAWTVRLAAIMYGLASIVIYMQGGLVRAIAIIGVLYILNIIRYLNVSDEKSATVNFAWKRFIWLNYVSGFIVTMVIIGLVI